MAYDDRIKDEIQAANDIVEVISQYLALKRSGRSFKGLCPFHQEKTPSFMVHPEKQIFHCFGCGAGGDVFSFVMRLDNVTFPEALKMLAERAHITLPVFNPKEKREADETEPLYEIYKLAVEYYHAEFLHPERGCAARDYFYKRGFDEETAREFKMGWAADAWQGLFQFLSQKGFSNTALLKSGLIQRSAKGNLYDVFRGRLLFPIHNLQGKVVAFGGRLLAEKAEGPKYLNSPENPVFHKRRELFGLHLAKKFVNRERPQILVTEGYFDFLRVYREGFRCVVATLGTSLTEEHVRLLRRFAEEAVVIYDGDKAGQTASLRGLEVFLEEGMSVKLVRMPEGYDPDDFLEKKGREAFQELVDQASDFFDFKLALLLERHNRWDSLGLMRITGDFLETLTKVKNPFLLDRYLRRLAASLGIDEQSLRRELIKLKEKTGRRLETGKSPEPVPPPTPHSAELMLLGLFIDEPSLREKVSEQVLPADFLDPEARDLYEKLLTLDLESPAGIWPQVLHRISNENFKERLLATIPFELLREEKEKVLKDCLMNLRRKHKGQRLEQLRKLIAQAEKEGDQGRIESYVHEYQALLKQQAPEVS